MSNGNRYNEEFKKTIVSLFNGGKSRGELSQEYNVSKTMIYQWNRLYSDIEVWDGTTTNNAEILKLKKQLAEKGLN